MRPDLPPLSVAQRAELAGATFLLLVCAASALGPLVAGSGWWWLCAFVSAGVLATGVGLRAIRTPVLLVPLLQGVAFVMLLTLCFGGTTSFAFIVPTGDTFGLFGSLMEGARVTIQQQSPPAVPVPALLFALALGIGLVTIVADLLVQVTRMPALAAAPALVPIMIPGFVIEDGAQPHTLIATAAAFLVLLRVDVRVRRIGVVRERELAGEDAPTVVAPARIPVVPTLAATVGMGAIGLIVASVLTAATPSISTSVFVGSGGNGTLFARGVSPFIDLGRDLRRPGPVDAFHYVTEHGDRPYFTLLTLDRFEGEVWGVSMRGLDSDNGVDEMPRPIGLANAVQSEEHRIQVTMDGLSTNWLPLPYPTAAIEGLRGSWFWDRLSMTVRSADTSTSGQRYTATLVDLSPTPSQLRAASDRVPTLVQPFLTLPDEVPQVIRDTAAAVTAGAPTRYDAAVAIQDWLRGSEFSYSTESPVREGYDGGGFEVIAAFLEAKQGYCVHFASTMAVFAREIGIPSRIAVGYTAGTSTEGRVNGRTVVQVDSHDLHAWPELYFEGVGWVPFEPTPGRGVVPAYTRENAGAANPFPSSSAGASAAATGRPELDPDRGLNQGAASAEVGVLGVSARVAAVALGVLLVLLAPALLRAGQRRSRRRRVRRGPGPAAAAWSEVRATVRDLGVPVPPSATPRTFATALAARPAFAEDAGGALSVLRDAVERERYGPPTPDGRHGHDPDELLEALGEVLHALEHDAPTPARWRARLLPASLLGALGELAGGRIARGA
ncbi:DUF3488 and DUF4129 domain-containing transglutaminase family protein [Agromyces sp. MMS24-JH15]|uniref:transglutaminase TgpA family protein n=1 Tax=Agromyces sp. MMS24-JH15 TaxID=3243765 RepID=UPI003749F1BC